MEFQEINQILDFAINEEQHAVDFYTSLAGMASTEDMKRVFNEFAQEEIGHKTKLQKIRQEGILHLGGERIADLKLADYMVTVKPYPGMSYQEALILAMKKEKAAFRLYTGLAEKTSNAELKQLFLMLAQEESKHKLRFEVEYDEFVLREN